MTQTVSVATAAKQIGSLIERVSSGKDRVIIERDGLPVALLVPARGARTTREERFRQFRVVDRIRDAFKDADEEEIQAEVTEALAAVRAESRQEKGGAPRGV